MIRCAADCLGLNCRLVDRVTKPEAGCFEFNNLTFLLQNDDVKTLILKAITQLNHIEHNHRPHKPKGSVQLPLHLPQIDAADSITHRVNMRVGHYRNRFFFSDGLGDHNGWECQRRRLI